MKSETALGLVVGAAFSVGAAAALIASRTVWKPKLKKSAIKHILLGKFKENISEEEISRLVEGYKGLVAKIPSMKGFEWGENVNKEGTGPSHTHVFVSTFDDEAGVKAYLDHPAHIEYAKELLPSLESVTVVDYGPKVHTSAFYA